MKNKHLVPLLLAVAFAPFLTSALGQVEPAKIAIVPTQPRLSNDDASEVPQAVVLTVHGRCDYSEDGTTFSAFKAGQVFKQGALVRTADGARADLFFRRIGTTVRLQSGTEVKLEKLERHMKDGVPVMDTLLELRTGRIFTVVRSLIPGCTLEIRNAAGRSIVEGGGGKGRYIITADGTHVTEKDSAVPLKIIRENGVTVIEPGMTFNAKEGKMFALEPTAAVQMLIEFDELDAVAETEASSGNLQTPK